MTAPASAARARGPQTRARFRLDDETYAELLPHVRNLAGDGMSDTEIAAKLSDPAPGRRISVYQVRRIRYRAGIEALNIGGGRLRDPDVPPRVIRGRARPSTPVLVEGVREPYIDKIRHLATVERMSDRVIAARVGLTKNQVWNLRKVFGIPAGQDTRRVRRLRLAAEQAAAAAVEAAAVAQEPIAERADTAAPKPTGAAARLEQPETVAPTAPPRPDTAAAADPSAGDGQREQQRIRRRRGMTSTCWTCDADVDAYTDNTAAPHKRLSARRNGLGSRKAEDCPGSGRTVRWRQSGSELADAANLGREVAA